MNGNRRLPLIKEKVERARKLFDDLVADRQAFFDTNPYKIESRRNLETGFDEFSVTSLKVPRNEISLIVGDCIHNLRSSLDHLAYQLVLVNNQTPRKQTAFPIFDDADTYNAQKASRVRGMAQNAIDAIDNARPYRGGSDQLWCLHGLDIADKHHKLLVTLVSVSEMAMLVPGKWWAPGNKVPLFSLPNFQTPLKDGDVFFTCEPGAEKNCNFGFDMALVDPDLPKFVVGRPLTRILEQLIETTDNTIMSFESHLQ